MSFEYATALQVLLIGMFTVFVILSIVVLWGGALIRIVNRFSSSAQSSEQKVEHSPSFIGQPSSVLSASKLIAISSAVNIATKGKARVVHIEKVQ